MTLQERSQAAAVIDGLLFVTLPMMAANMALSQTFIAQVMLRREMVRKEK